GNLFSSTLGCGANGAGTVFELTPGAGGSWTETILYNFTAGDDGYEPGSLVLDKAGNLYGTTLEGGGTKHGNGTVFELQPSGRGWSFTTLYRFADALYPSSSLALDSSGNLYGTTEYGGGAGTCSRVGCGIVFRLARTGSTWKYQVLHRLAGKPSAVPVGAP